MADSTPHSSSHPPSRGRIGAAAILAASLLLAVLAVLAVVPSQSRADGDPASDVLAAQSLFLPQDAAAQPILARRLAAILAAGGRRAGLRVAVVASSADLGAVTALWRQPQSYARFLGQEVSLLYRGEILVVMPDGYGLARDGQAPPAADAAALAALPTPGHQLVAAALRAAERLARAHGITLTATTGAAAAPASAGTSPFTVIVFAAGLVTIALAWGVSLRIRPAGRLRSR